MCVKVHKVDLAVVLQTASFVELQRGCVSKATEVGVEEVGVVRSDCTVGECGLRSHTCVVPFQLDSLLTKSSIGTLLLRAMSDGKGCRQSVGKGYHPVGKGYYSVGKRCQSVGKGYHSVGKGCHSVGKGYHSVGKGCRSVGKGCRSVSKGSPLCEENINCYGIWCRCSSYRGCGQSISVF